MVGYKGKQARRVGVASSRLFPAGQRAQSGRTSSGRELLYQMKNAVACSTVRTQFHGTGMSHLKGRVLPGFFNFGLRRRERAMIRRFR